MQQMESRAIHLKHSTEAISMQKSAHFHLNMVHSFSSLQLNLLNQHYIMDLSGALVFFFKQKSITNLLCRLRRASLRVLLMLLNSDVSLVIFFFFTW